MSEAQCPVCGSSLKPEAAFCESCGSNLASAGLKREAQEPSVASAAPERPAVGPISAVSQVPQRPAGRVLSLQTIVVISLGVAIVLLISVISLLRRGQAPPSAGQAQAPNSSPITAKGQPDVLDRALEDGRSLAEFNQRLDADLASVEEEAGNVEAADDADTAAWAANLGLSSTGGLPDIDQALIYAAGFDDLPHMKALLRQHPDLSAIGEHGMDALHTAAFNGSRGALVLLMDAGADPNAQSPDGSGTALHLAAVGGDYLSCAVLLRGGADSGAYDGSGLTPLLSAVSLGNGEAAQLLIDYGADVDSRSEDGLTALMAAAQRGQSEMLRLLLQNGADVSLQDPAGWTALHFAAAAGDSACINALDSAGADRDARDMNGDSPADVARKNGNRDAAEQL